MKTEKRICEFCGKEFIDNSISCPRKYCSILCRNRARNVRKGATKLHQEVEKQCIVCGKTFTTFILHKKTCSDECSKINRNKRKRKPYTEEQKQKRKEKDRQRYLKKHPGARTQEEISECKRLRDLKEATERERRKKEYERKQQERAEICAKKEAQKQANIAYWQKYEDEHECFLCGKKFIAHYPLKKYCSTTCAKKNSRVRDSRHRYKNITVDKGITLPKLAKRDHNQCKICGLFVDWNDFIETDKTKICGDMYPSIDHIKPISLGGLHSWDNVQLAHRKCNSGKSNNYVG